MNHAADRTAPRRGVRSAEVPQPWRTLARVAIVAFAAGMLTLWFLGLPVRFRALAQLCTAGDACLALYLGPLEAAAMPAWLSFEAYAFYITAIEGVVVVAGLTVAGLLLARLSHTRMGLLAAAALVWVGFVGEVIASLAAEVPAVEAALSAGGYVGLTVFWFFLLLFPDGRIEARWMRRWLPAFVALLLGAQIVGSLSQWGLVSDQSVLASEPGWFAVFFPIVLTPFALQVVRFLRVGPEQRQQLKWGLVGLGAMMLGFVVWVSIDPATTPVPGGGPRLAWNVVGWSLSLVCATMLPVSIGYAVLRHRLWDLDVVINRALVYGSLTLMLTGIYFGTVVSVQRVVLGGRDSPLVVAGPTLLIAALFAPLRRCIQAFIDRRFYRRKVDARRALSAFASAARSQVDLDALTRELLHAVGDAVQPSRMGVWLRSGREAGDEEGR